MAKYVDPAFNEKKYRAGINTSAYDKAVKAYNAQAEKQRAAQLGEAQKVQQGALRNAYVNRLQNEQQLNNNLAAAGIRGGATETSNLRLANMYGQARANADSNYANSVNSINSSIDQNIFDYTQDMNARKEQYLNDTAMARWQADREAALARWNAAREDEQLRINRKREDKNNAINRKREDKANEQARLTEYYSNYYTNLYSGYSKKSAQKEMKTINSRIKKAKTWQAKMRWQQAKAALGARLGVIATSK